MYLFVQISMNLQLRQTIFITLVVLITNICLSQSLLSENVSLQVIDGDTLKIGEKRFRIFGIDTPEKNQTCTTNNRQWACGLVATSELIKLVAGKTVVCKKRDVDRYKRIVAVCLTDNGDVGKAMVASGWALAYRQYSLDYVKDEEKAKSEKLGLWSSQFVEPWRWRKESGTLEKEAAASSSNPECLIKGNISSNGSRIYHPPGGAYYSRTKIDLSRGERWFCSAIEAEKAGWRASMR